MSPSGAAIGTVLDAEAARQKARDEEQAKQAIAESELGQLEPERKLLEEKAKIKKLREELGIID